MARRFGSVSAVVAGRSTPRCPAPASRGLGLGQLGLGKLRRGKGVHSLLIVDNALSMGVRYGDAGVMCSAYVAEDVRMAALGRVSQTARVR
jgi:hypothetical protein